MMMGSSEIRARFLDFFKRHDHEIVASSSLIPAYDPSLLFTNSGMVQFKDVFLGREKRPYTKAASVQRCVRAGGKHNDLDNVGYTARHHTFFEMLGNFSFGDYFKRDAIMYAWTFLSEELKLPAERLWVTVFDDDEESASIWLGEIGIDPAHLGRCGERDNFWRMGDTGPCGPCSEIFYDHGETLAGGPPGKEGVVGDRYVEIWNLVFTQYNRDTDGKLTPLPSPSVDTGMGLERIAAVMQGVHDNYAIDLFQSLMATIRSLVATGEGDDLVALRVIADHIRTIVFLISDGVVPANEGRGYVLRRIIRRAVRYAHTLGATEPVLHGLVAPFANLMGDTYPELRQRCEHIERTVLDEEQRFTETLTQGLKHFESMLDGLSGTVIAGDDAFKLYDTYGFPLDLTANIARERGLTVDQAGFDAALAAQRMRARAGGMFTTDNEPLPACDQTTIFDGYDLTATTPPLEAAITALYADGEAVSSLSAGRGGIVITDHTPFYAEAGGQIGDTGELATDDAVFGVDDTQKHADAVAHIGTLKHGALEIGQRVRCAVDWRRRRAIMCNHSATHLLHAALKRVLGAHVEQKGSFVGAKALRFDFSHPTPVDRMALLEIEALVNSQVLANQATEVAVMPLAEAKRAGAVALFGERYGDRVRVLKIGGDFSVELCGGTHVGTAAEIGAMKIVSESGVAAGIRRIEAVTGEAALAWGTESEETLNALMTLLKAERGSVVRCLRQQLDKTRALEKSLAKLQSEVVHAFENDVVRTAVDIDGIKVGTKALPDVDVKTLRNAVDHLKHRLGRAVVVLATVDGGTVRIVAGVTRDLTATITAGDLVNYVAEQVGGKGGGRPDLAEAGGDDPARLDAALMSVAEWVRSKALVVDKH